MDSAEAMAHGPVFVWGHSLGTGVAVEMATERHVRGVILEAAFTTIPDLSKGQYRWIPSRVVDFMMPDRFDNLAKITLIHAPLLLLHGQADDVVPFDQGMLLYRTAHQPKEGVFTELGQHGDLMTPFAISKVKSFIDEYE